jgi:hypothetical protein
MVPDVCECSGAQLTDACTSAAAAAAAVDYCSGLLVRHARRVLGAAADVLNKPGRPRMLKAVREVGQRYEIIYVLTPVAFSCNDFKA